MAEIVNLRQFRKNRARGAAAKTADENSARYGRRKDDKAREAAELELAERRLSGHVRHVDPKDGDDRP